VEVTGWNARLAWMATLAVFGILAPSMAPPPAQAQFTAAAFDDVEAQLRVRQAANAAGTATREVDELRKALDVERKRVLSTAEERDLNRELIASLEKNLHEAEARQRERDAALKEAQEARNKGLAAEAQRQKLEEAKRVAAATSSTQTAPPTPAGWIADPATGCRVWNASPQPGEAMGWSGPCQNNLAQGRGVLQWFKDGKPIARYEGDYREGKVNGRGRYTWASGSRFEGEFRDDRPNGQGAFTQVNGTVFSGVWKNGCFRQGDRKAWVMTSYKECAFD
jgi:hypothetical protein